MECSISFGAYQGVVPGWTFQTCCAGPQVPHHMLIRSGVFETNNQSLRQIL